VDEGVSGQHHIKLERVAAGQLSVKVRVGRFVCIRDARSSLRQHTWDMLRFQILMTEGSEEWVEIIGF